MRAKWAVAKMAQCALLIYVEKPNVFRSGSPRDSVFAPGLCEGIRPQRRERSSGLQNFRRLALAMIPLTTMGVFETSAKTAATSKL